MIHSRPICQHFNPRSHEGSDSPGPIFTGSGNDFNPRSHEGSDGFRELPEDDKEISIHAPTRGATLFVNYAGVLILISIHAPTRGATVEPSGSIERAAISIHAPTRGATILLSRCLQFIRFQSTLPRGERQKKERCYKWHSGFQSTLPRGERQRLRERLVLRIVISIHAPTRGATITAVAGIPTQCNFNPRSHEGSDWEMYG